MPFASSSIRPVCSRLFSSIKARTPSAPSLAPNASRSAAPAFSASSWLSQARLRIDRNDPQRPNARDPNAVLKYLFKAEWLIKARRGGLAALSPTHRSTRSAKMLHSDSPVGPAAQQGCKRPHHRFHDHLLASSSHMPPPLHPSYAPRHGISDFFHLHGAVSAKGYQNQRICYNRRYV